MILTAITFLNSINRLVFIMEMQVLYIIHMKRQHTSEK